MKNTNMNSLKKEYEAAFNNSQKNRIKDTKDFLDIVWVIALIAVFIKGCQVIWG